MDAVEQLVGTAKIAAFRDVTVHKAALQAVQARLPGITADFGVAETMVGEPGFKDLLAPALEDKDIHGFGVLVGKNVESPVRLNELGVPDADFPAPRASDLKPDPARKILAEIENMDARTRAPNSRGHNVYRPPQGRQQLG